MRLRGTGADRAGRLWGCGAAFRSPLAGDGGGLRWPMRSAPALIGATAGRLRAA